MEKENEERIEHDASSDTAEGIETADSAGSEPLEQPETVSRKRRQLPDLTTMLSNQNLLAQISSTGVLLKSLDKSTSTLDFVFVLNVRESELYPPLVLREDFLCLEDKLNTYKREYDSGELFSRKQTLKISLLGYEIVFIFHPFPCFPFMLAVQIMLKSTLIWSKISC